MLTVRVEIDRPEPLNRRAEWVCSTWLDALGLPRTTNGAADATLLTYGVAPSETPPGSLVFLPADIAPSDEPERLSLDGFDLPVPAAATVETAGDVLLTWADRDGAAPGRPAAVRDERGRIVCGADLVASSFFFLACRQETDEAGRDSLDRFLADGSLAARWSVLRTPVAEHYALLVGQWLETLAVDAGRFVLRTARWPGHRAGAIFLSHDIDLLKAATPAAAVKDLARALDPRRPGWGVAPAARGVVEAIRGLVARRHATLNLESIIEIERRHEARSTFYFLPDVPDTVLPGRRAVGSYPAGETAVRGELNAVLRAGYEVGVHGSFETYRDPDRMRSEKRRLETRAGVKTVSNRQHFLRLRIPETLRLLQQSGFTSDASVGYSDAEGFRAGWSLPYHPYDTDVEAPLELLELPLSTMEGVFLDRRKLAAGAAWRSIAGLLESTRARAGMLSVLWHNTSYLEGYAAGYAGLYERILDWSRSHDMWCCAATDVENWWRRRRELRLEPDGAKTVVIHGGDAGQRIWLELAARSSAGIAVSGGGRLLGDRPARSGDRALELECDGGAMVIGVG